MISFEDKELLIKDIIDAAYSVHRVLTPGYLESVYKEAMIYELSLRGLSGKTEVPIKVSYKGHPVGNFAADIIVEDCIIVELKAVENLKTAHEAQLVNYLTATGINDGLLINFGSTLIDIRRKYRIYNQSRMF